MPRGVRYHERFIDDARRQIDWLVEAERVMWLEALLVGIEEVAALVRRFPSAGRVIAEDERVVLRAIRLRRYPYLVHYGYRRASPIGDVWLVRLFGAHQDRPDPDPSGWVLS